MTILESRPRWPHGSRSTRAWRRSRRCGVECPLLPRPLAPGRARDDGLREPRARVPAPERAAASGGSCRTATSSTSIDTARRAWTAPRPRAGGGRVPRARGLVTRPVRPRPRRGRPLPRPRRARAQLPRLLGGAEPAAALLSLRRHRRTSTRSSRASRRSGPGRPIVLAGFSLGGNVVVKYVGERGDELAAEVRGAVGVSVPFDLLRSALRSTRPGSGTGSTASASCGSCARSRSRRPAASPRHFDVARDPDGSLVRGVRRGGDRAAPRVRVGGGLLDALVVRPLTSPACAARSSPSRRSTIRSSRPAPCPSRRRARTRASRSRPDARRAATSRSCRAGRSGRLLGRAPRGRLPRGGRGVAAAVAAARRPSTRRAARAARPAPRDGGAEPRPRPARAPATSGRLPLEREVEREARREHGAGHERARPGAYGPTRPGEPVVRGPAVHDRHVDRVDAERGTTDRRDARRAPSQARFESAASTSSTTPERNGTGADGPSASPRRRSRSVARDEGGADHRHVRGAPAAPGAAEERR